MRTANGLEQWSLAENQTKDTESVTKRINTGAERGRRRDEAGIALLVVALSMVVLLGFMGLGIDMSYLRTVKQRMQTASDAAALAGASELSYGDVTSAAKADAATNGFTDGVNGVTVTVNNPPQTASDPHYNDSKYVETIISQNVPTMFGKIFGTKTVTVVARSEAHLGSAPNCMYALNPTAQDAVTINGSTVTSQCGMIVDSSASQALLINGSKYSGTTIGVTGGDLVNGSTVTPTPQIGVAATPDPLAYLTAPTVGSCQYTNTVISGAPGVLYPGVYCGGINVNGSSLTTFSPGLYIIANADSKGYALNINGSSVTGSGVTFYNAAGAVSVNGAGVNLVAPTTGTYPGILFFQSPSDTDPAAVNGSTPVFQGTLYFPEANLTYNGSGADYTILVAGTLVVNGSFNADYSSLPGGSPVRSNTAVLDE
jgi:Flp pilus assembly protein TadG